MTWGGEKQTRLQVHSYFENNKHINIKIIIFIPTRAFQNRYKKNPAGLISYEQYLTYLSNNI